MSEQSVVHQDRRHGRGVVVFVTGTGTEVGKTWVSAELARLLHAHRLRKGGSSISPPDRS